MLTRPRLLYRLPQACTQIKMISPTRSQLIEADAQLAQVFSHFYCVQQAADALPIRQQLLPNYEMLLAFNFGPAIPVWLGDAHQLIRQTAVLGPLQRTLVYELPAGADLIVVNFTLNGFYRLWGRALHRPKALELPNADAVFDVDSLAVLWRQLASLTALPDRLRTFSAYALTHLSPVDAVTRSLLDYAPLFGQTAVDPIKAVAQTNQVSVRSIQARLKTQVGFSAKELVRFLRFKQVLSVLMQRNATEQATIPVDWLALVLRFGYHDQSHLIKDFRYFLGITPRQFIRQLAQGEVCMSKSGKFY